MKGAIDVNPYTNTTMYAGYTSIRPMCYNRSFQIARDAWKTNTDYAFEKKIQYKILWE